MSPRSPLRLVGALALAVLMLVCAVDAAEASLRIFWRFAVLSFDNPTTQLADELVCESSPPSQAGAEARQVTRLAIRPAGRVTLADAQPLGAAPDRGAGITRAPPSA